MKDDANREEPCEYCEGDSRKLIVVPEDFRDGTFSVYVNAKGELDIEYHGVEEWLDHSAPISYCPMCGRDLRGSQA